MQEMQDVAEHASTILVADDEPNVRDVIRLMLAEEGHRLVFAENGAEAFEKAYELVPT